jgi:predicted AAA+ superfamily ATPase
MQGQLKKIFDFLGLRVIFTSSSSLELSEGRYGLSRRLTVRHLPLFSFREYLLFGKKSDLPVLTVEEIINNHREIYTNLFAFEPDFRLWSEIGALPACLDSPLSSIISSTVDKVIQHVSCQ